MKHEIFPSKSHIFSYLRGYHLAIGKKIGMQFFEFVVAKNEFFGKLIYQVEC